MTTHTTRMLILGSGPAGLSAAIYGARAGMAPIVVQGIQPGGQLTTTTDVENYPGFKDVIQGPWLMEQMQAQAEHVGTRMMWDTIVQVDLTSRPFRLIGDSGDVYEGDTLVIATGAQAKWLGIDSEEPMKGKGVSACATCDGFFYRGKKVAVIGGGNTAVEEALYLTNHSPDVTLIHRRDSLRSEKILQERLFAHKGVTVLWNKEVREFVDGGGNAGLVALELEDTVTGERSRLRRDRPPPRDRAVPRAYRSRFGRLYLGRDRLHAHQRRGRVRVRRRGGQGLPPGGDRSGHRLHGRTRRRTVPGGGGVRRTGRSRGVNEGRASDSRPSHPPSS
jgi:thioredoxin reductase (NADPH)